MLGYNVRIGLKSIRRNPVLSAVIVGGIALGIGVATMFAAGRHALAKDPLPRKSATLHYVRIDNWDPAKPYPGPDPNRPPEQLSYLDAMNLRQSKIPLRQSAMFKAMMRLVPEDTSKRPQRAVGRLCYRDFFEMFEVPFRYGGPWSAAADQAPEQVVVLSERLNERLFGGADSVGRTLQVNERPFKVVGVLHRWTPTVKFYDMSQSALQETEALFIPFALFQPLEIRTTGNVDAWKSPEGVGIERILDGNTIWLQYWVELATPRDREAYEAYLNAYVLDQQHHGRLPRRVNNRVTPLRDWIKEKEVVPDEIDGMLIVSLLFLVVCALNLMGLLLGKFLARASEVGVRRALGARRRDIFMQHLVECEVIAVIGGALGLLLSLGGLYWINTVFQLIAGRRGLFTLDFEIAVLAIIMSLTAGLIAGAYPAWRICRIPPADHLKMM
ncbi:MAG: ABC transporter permease [Acidobacteria bacterium]|nr:ABC transporter permease [Acidobacteriota bacterium]